MIRVSKVKRSPNKNRFEYRNRIGVNRLLFAMSNTQRPDVQKVFMQVRIAGLIAGSSVSCISMMFT